MVLETLIVAVIASFIIILDQKSYGTHEDYCKNETSEIIIEKIRANTKYPFNPQYVLKGSQWIKC
jgi:hypothetical protein